MKPNFEKRLREAEAKNSKGEFKIRLVLGNRHLNEPDDGTPKIRLNLGGGMLKNRGSVLPDYGYGEPDDNQDALSNSKQSE